MPQCAAPNLESGIPEFGIRVPHRLRLQHMELLLLLKTIVMGIVEGLTEFLPVSSTGHLIAADALIKYQAALGGKEIADTFEIFIQLGAILAVVVFFARDLIDLLRRATRERAAQMTLFGVLLAFVPAAAIGFLARKVIKAYLFSPMTVAIMLIVGGVIMLIVESRPRRARTLELDDVSWKQALAIGLAQVAALVPGVSRSAATLIGGMYAGLDRPTALRFSFYLSIPTLGIATLYDFYKSRDLITSSVLPVFGIGLVVAFFVALLVVKFFLRYVSTRDLRPFAWYRIVAGWALIALSLAGALG
jgi:undecaprenyl-diphosphatase